MSKRRVVVTGMGIVSPVGNDIATAWSNVVEGRSGIGPVTHFDASGYATRIAGEVRDFDASAWVPPKDVTRMDPFIHYGIAAGLQAFRDSGFTITEQNAERVGVAVGAGIGGLDTIESTTLELAARGPRKVSPFYVPARSSTWFRAIFRSTWASPARTSRWCRRVPQLRTTSAWPCA